MTSPESSPQTVADEFLEVCDQYRTSVKEAVDAIDAAMTVLASASGGAVLLNPITTGPALAAAGALLLCERYRPEIEEAIRLLTEKIEECGKGIQAPVLFLTYANQWNATVNSHLIEVNNDLDYTTLMGQYEGGAALRYRDSRSLQYSAVSTVSGICDKVAGSLTTLAQSGVKFYLDVIDHIVDVIKNIPGIITKAATLALIPLAIEDLLDLIGDALELVSNVLSSFVTSAITEWVEVNNLKKILYSQTGLPDNNWPAATADQFSPDNGAQWSVVPS